MYAERQSVSVTTDASGNATVYSTVVTGRILCIRYVKPGSSPLDNGVDCTITLESSGESVLTLANFGAASGSYYPRVPVQDETGADATLDGTRKMREPVVAANDRLKFVVAQGGNALSGSFIVVVG